MRTHASSVLFFLSGITVAHNETDTPRGKAIVPTSSGQIGINPVSAEPKESYLGIGPNSNYYQQDGSTTKWIGVNTEYLTDLVVTTTINNQPTTTTEPVPIVFTTATADADGLAKGDVSVVVSPKLLGVLQKIASKVASSCSAKKRQECNYAQAYGQAVSNEMRAGGQLDYDYPSWVPRFNPPLINAPDIALILSSITGVRAPIFLNIYLFLYIVGMESANGNGVANIPPAAKIPATMTEKPTSTLTSTSTSSSTSSCPFDAPTGLDAPVCPDDDCKGDNKPNSKCTEGRWKECDCLVELDSIAQEGDEQWMDDQQTILQAAIDTADPWCLYGGDPNGNKIPDEYCQCGDNHASTYSVASATTSPYDPCPYTTPPGSTITFQPKSMASASPTQAPGNPAKGTCNGHRDNWMNRDVAVNTAGAKFCKDNNGQFLRKPPLNLYSNAVTAYYDDTDVSGTGDKQPKIFVYAYSDASCSDSDIQKHNEVVEADCMNAIWKVIDECDISTTDQKMGGAATINCQYYNMSAVPSSFGSGSRLRRFLGE